MSQMLEVRSQVTRPSAIRSPVVVVSAFATLAIATLLAFGPNDDDTEANAASSGPNQRGGSFTGPSAELPSAIPKLSEEDCQVICAPDKRPTVCGHRGFGVSTQVNEYPENSIPSFTHALQNGARMVEFDVTLTLDGKVIVLHDDRLNRTTNGSGCIGSYTFGELREREPKLSLGRAASGKRHPPLPTLEDTLQQVEGDMNIELKIHQSPLCPQTDRHKLATEVVALLAQNPTPKRRLVSSFDLDILSQIEQLNPDIETGLLSDDPRSLQQVLDHHLDAWHLGASEVSVETVSMAEARHIPIHIWTENDPRRIEQLTLLGVDMIITDHPGQANDVIDTVCAACQ